MTVLNIILAFLLLMIAPTMIGYCVEGIIGKKSCTIGRMYITGTFAMYALFQLLFVPMILMKFSFHLACIVASVGYLMLIAYGLIRHACHIEKPSMDFKDVWDVLLFVSMMLVLVYVILCLFRYTHIDDDDSRFVVNAVDMVRTDTMYRTNPATGKPLEMEWAGELKKDIISPWAAYQAYAAKLTLVHPTVMCHTVLPVATYLNLFLIQWELSSHFVGGRIKNRSLYCMLLWIAILYLNYNGWTAEGFLVRRIWQGKAVVAGVGTPLLLLLFFELYDSGERYSYFMLAITNMALCLLSNMGILLGAMFTVCFGLAYGILKKNWKLTVAVWLTVIPNIVYAAFRIVI